MISRQALRNLYNDLKELSSSELQARFWFDKSSPRISSYVELMCRLFDDDAFEYFIEKEVAELTDSTELISNLIILRDKLNTYNVSEEKDQYEIFTDPAWEEIRKLAHTVIELWDKNIPVHD